MKVLLLQAYAGRHEAGDRIFPLGLSYIATALANAHHHVHLLDMQLHRDPLFALRKTLQEVQPELVGVSLRNIDTTDRLDPFYYYEALGGTLREIRAVAGQRVCIVIGGAGFSLFPRQIMERHPELDYGVYLEGDESAPELLANLNSPERVPGVFYRRGGVVHFTGRRRFPDFAVLPMPRRDFAGIASYRGPRGLGVQAKRGCVLECSYCPYPMLNGRNLRLRSAEDVVGELSHLQSAFGVDEVIFTDSVFNLPEAHASAICEEMLRCHLRMKWSAWFDLRGLREEFVQLVAQAGCYRMCFSPDGANSAIRRTLRKNCDEADVRNALQIARAHPEIDFRFSFFCMPPGQDIRGVIDTLKLIVHTHLLLPNSKCLVSWVRVLPNTQMEIVAKQEGVLQADVDLLPEHGRDLPPLYYSCPDLGAWATPLFESVIRICSVTRKVLERVGWSR